MKAIRVDELREGMAFSKPVYVDGETILVPANVHIREKDLERLSKWGVEVVETEGKPLPDGLSRKEPEVYREIIESKKDRELFTLYLRSVDGLGKIFQDVHDGIKVELDQIDTIVNALFPAIRENGDILVSYTMRSEAIANSLALSSVNIMIVSMMIALNMKLPSHRLIQLAIAALLHDIGMMRIPEEILSKKEQLSPKELQTMATHTIQSYEIITRELKYPEAVALAALHHHERWDGRGYPKKLSGKGIPLASRIISVVDAFEAMVKDRPYRNSMIGYTAMRQILNDNSRRFDSEILKIFIKSMGIYPLGSMVILNSGDIGRVIRIHQDAPLRPVLRIIVDKIGRKFKAARGPEIDLLEEKSLFIARALNPKEITGKSE